MNKNKKNKENRSDIDELKLKKQDIEEAEEQDEEESIIQEQIKPWHKRKFKKVMSVIGFSLLAGIIFGIAARFVFKYSDGIISKIFGLNQPYDSPNSQPPVNINPSPDQQKVSTDKDGVSFNIDNPETSEGAVPTVVIEDDGSALASYRLAMEQMRIKSEKVRKGVVKISAVTSIVNWLGESIEQSESSLGIVVAENPTNLFVVTYYDKVKNADRIEITLKSRNTYTVPLLNYDDSYNLAVLVLSKQVLKQEDFSTLALLEIGNSDSVYAGMPIIAVGSIDGKNELVEYGVVTGDSYVDYITDAIIEIFTTDIEHSENGEGIVTDLDGKLVGIITRKLGESVEADVNKCMRVNDLIKVAEKLCNGESRLYFGIKAENIPEWALRENNIENGIYVNGVEPSSPASDAGLRKGDFITAINGRKINEVSEFSEILMDATENSELVIVGYRVSKSASPEFTVTVKPEKRNN